MRKNEPGKILKRNNNAFAAKRSEHVKGLQKETDRGFIGGSPVLKIECGPRMQILGPFGPPNKRVNFDICNKRQKWVICDSVNLTNYVSQYKFSFVVL